MSKISQMTDEEFEVYEANLKLQQKKWREKNPEKVKAAHDRYVEKNKAHLKEVRREYNKRRWLEIKSRKEIKEKE